MSDATTALAAAQAAAASASGAADAEAGAAESVATALTHRNAAQAARTGAEAARDDAQDAASTAAADALAAVTPANDVSMTAVDNNAASAFRVQSDARLSATFAGKPTIDAADLAILMRDRTVANGVSWTTPHESIARTLGWVIVTDARYAGGAVGDGTTVTTAALQAAFAALPWPAQRAGIFFPPGNYLTDANITISGGGATSTPQLHIAAEGACISTTTNGVTILDITNTAVSLTRVSVAGLMIRTNASGGSTGVRLNNAELCTFDRCTFTGNFGTAVKITGTSTYNTFKGCEFSQLSRGFEITGTASYLTIEGCQFAEQTAGNPLNWINADTVQSVGVKINGCTFYGEGNTLPAINIVQGYGWSVTGCTFAYCSDIAVFIGRDGVSYGHTVSGCTFDHNGKDDIKIDGGKLNTVSGCYFGVRKVGTPVSTYCNVTILNTTGGTAGSDNSVIGCTSKDTGTALLASFSAHASCQNVNFIGNQYAIAPVNANTSAATFGRDGAQIPTGKQITRDGISFPSVLARVTSIDAKVVAATTLYTVPTGKTAVILGAVVQSGAVTAITAGPTLGIGIAAGEDDIYPSTALTGLTSNAKTYVFAPPGLQASAPAGSVIKLGIDTASTGTAQLVSVALLGFLL